MKLGAEPKKVAILGVLALVGGYTLYTNVLSDSSAPSPQTSAQTSPRTSPPVAAAPSPGQIVPPAAARGAQPSIRRAGSRNRSGEEWRPSLRRRSDDPLDPMQVDPTLQLDLLAKVQGVSAEGGSRNLFQFSTPPPPPAPPAPKTPEPKIVPKPAEVAQSLSTPAVKPPPPPINLKYYGFSTVRNGGAKTAFFLDGEDVLVATEGQLVKRRYKVVRIGVNSVVMEDIEAKSEQTLPLTQEATGA
jgi:hypothetical protein